jgi:hypothetical protein
MAGSPSAGRPKTIGRPVARGRKAAKNARFTQGAVSRDGHHHADGDRPCFLIEPGRLPTGHPDALCRPGRGRGRRQHSPDTTPLSDLGRTRTARPTRIREVHPGDPAAGKRRPRSRRSWPGRVPGQLLAALRPGPSPHPVESDRGSVGTCRGRAREVRRLAFENPVRGGVNRT